MSLCHPHFSGPAKLAAPQYSSNEFDSAFGLHNFSILYESRLFLSRMGKETSEGGKVEDLEILSASLLARKISNQGFMCRAHFPLGIFFRRSVFCLNNNFHLLGSKVYQQLRVGEYAHSVAYMIDIATFFPRQLKRRNKVVRFRFCRPVSTRDM